MASFRPLYRIAFLLLLALTPCFAQPAGNSATTPKQWAADAASLVVKDFGPYQSFLRYQSHTIDSKGDLLRDIIESRDGAVARLIAKNGRPLTAEEDQAEQQRLQAILDDPDAFAKHIKNDAASKKQAGDIVKLIPDAMTFTYTEGQPQLPGAQATSIVIDFHPNPAWSPPTMPSEALTGLEGRLWIDPQTHRLLRIEADVFRPVNVGFGIFAKLFPGGTAALDQMPAGDRRWMPTHVVEHVTLRALMVKTYKQNIDIHNSNFTPVESMTYQQAVHLLLATPLPH